MAGLALVRRLVVKLPKRLADRVLIMLVGSADNIITKSGFIFFPLPWGLMYREDTFSTKLIYLNISYISLCVLHIDWQKTILI